MQIKQQIVNALRGGFPMSDNEIARVISRPVPSVRRARLELEKDYSGIGPSVVQTHRHGPPMTWKLAEVR